MPHFDPCSRAGHRTVGLLSRERHGFSSRLTVADIAVTCCMVSGEAGMTFPYDQELFIVFITQSTDYPFVMQHSWGQSTDGGVSTHIWA
jgi:hypothetical protein